MTHNHLTTFEPTAVFLFSDRIVEGRENVKVLPGRKIFRVMINRVAKAWLRHWDEALKNRDE
jgi:hypothetical protein